MNLKRTAAGLLAALCLLGAPARAFTTCAVDGTARASGVTHTLTSRGRYTNWAGVSSVSQFADERGRFCFAVDGGDHVDVYRTDDGGAVLEDETVTIANPYDRFGGAVCGEDGSLYLIWGRNGDGADTAAPTIFVSKHTPDGALVATASGNGSEGMPYWYNYPAYGGEFNSKLPFDSGNCDAALNGGVLMVNYAREMYNGHQANTLFAVDAETMTALSGFAYYNSHSFDQRVSPCGGGFVLATQGDCYDRGFALTAANRRGNGDSVVTFNFWVERGALDENDMWKLNKTRARLGNVLETEAGVALIGASARSLSAAADSEPQDVFVQVLTRDLKGYVTEGERSGVAGNTGDKEVTDHGVRWLTALGGGMTADVVQAVALDGGRLAVLYELSRKGTYSNSYDSTWMAVLNADGSVLQTPMRLGTMRLNADEDPVFSGGAVRWAANAGSGTLTVYSLRVETAKTGVMGDGDDAVTWGLLKDTLTVYNGALSAAEPLYAASYDADGRMLGVSVLTAAMQEATLPQDAARVKLFRPDASGAPKCAAAAAR